MQRFTISLDDALAAQFDALIAQRGYSNRSEAVRDLIREQMDRQQLQSEQAAQCVANVSYVYDHHEQPVTARVLDLQHEHHDLVITSLHTHLDHDHCLETVVLRGPTAAVRQTAEQLIALRGVRHGNIHLVPLDASGAGHSHAHAPKARHAHFKPLN
jgi:CopG family nickel-responsive transcriptional regulator